MRCTFPFVALVCASAALTGCAVRDNTVASAAVTAGTLTGHVMGGQQVIQGSTVTLYVAGTSGYGMGATALAIGTTNAAGEFNLSSFTCPYANAPTYMLAAGGNSGAGTNPDIMLAAATGPCSGVEGEFVAINETTTAATAFALSHFFTATLGTGSSDAFGATAAGGGVYSPGLVMASEVTVPALVDTATGHALTTATAGGLTITREAAKLNSIADTLAACVNSTGETDTIEANTTCGKLFSATRPPNASTRPSDTLQAAVEMALYPYQNVSALYQLASTAPPFVGLTSAPSDWTLGISYSSAGFGLGVGGDTSSTIDIDTSGRIWFPTNAANAHGLAYFDPVSVSFNGPYATGLVTPQYVAIDNQGNVFGDDLSTAQVAGVTVASPAGAVTTYAAAGPTGPVVAGFGTQSKTASQDSLLFTVGTGLYEELAGKVTSLATYNAAPTGLLEYGPFSPPDVDAAAGGNGSACTYETDASGVGVKVDATSAPGCVAGGISNAGQGTDSVMTASTLNQLCDFGSSSGGGSCFASPVPVSTPEGIAVDGDGTLWIANAGNASVSTLGYLRAHSNSIDYFQTSPVAYVHDSNNGGTMAAPYGLAIDASGNVWVSNAGCVTMAVTCTLGSFVLSELVGAAAPTITPLAAQTVPGIEGTRP